MGSEPEWAGPEQLRMMSQRSPASILYSNASCNINRMNSFCKNLKGFWDSKDVFKKHISHETLPWPKCLPKRGLGWFYIKKRLSTTSSKKFSSHAPLYCLAQYLSALDNLICLHLWSRAGSYWDLSKDLLYSWRITKVTKEIFIWHL